MKTNLKIALSSGLVILLIVGLAAFSISAINGLDDEAPIPNGTTIVIGLAVAALAAFIGQNIWIGGSFARPMRRFHQSLDAFANGDPELAIQTGQELANSSSIQDIQQLGSAIARAGNYYKEKIAWHESILDALPFPLSITDMDMNWTFINRPVENLLKSKRADIVGKSCNHWNANICNTEKCGIHRLRNNFLTTYFDQWGLNFRVNAAYLYNSKGEKVGHVEAVSEVTDLVASMRYMDTAVKNLSSSLDELARGSLAFEIPELPPSDEHTQQAYESFRSVYRSLATARERLNQAIAVVADNATRLTEASDHLAIAASQAGQATAQISITIQQVASGTAEQSNSASRMTETMDNVSKTVDGVQKGTLDQSQAIEQASEVAQKISSADGISSLVNKSAQKVQEMGARSEQIGQIIETIEDIASQTNLLALNAAIEAARAGEHGKGFSVVADEVRKLAEKSAVATREISTLIKGIQKTVIEAVEMATTASVEINAASSELSQSIDDASNVLNSNKVATMKLAENTNEVMQAVENIASVSEENSASVEEVSASTEEMNAQVEEVSSSAHSLSEMAKDLQEAIRHFTLAKAAPGEERVSSRTVSLH